MFTGKFLIVEFEEFQILCSGLSCVWFGYFLLLSADFNAEFFGVRLTYFEIFLNTISGKIWRFGLSFLFLGWGWSNEHPDTTLLGRCRWTLKDWNSGGSPLGDTFAEWFLFFLFAGAGGVLLLWWFWLVIGDVFFSWVGVVELFFILRPNGFPFLDDLRDEFWLSHSGVLMFVFVVSLSGELSI